MILANNTRVGNANL